VIRIMTGVILLLWAVEDIRYKSIQNIHLAGGSVLLLLLVVLEGRGMDGSSVGRGGVADVVVGMSPGLLLLLLSVTGGNVVGAADGVVILLLGTIYGVWEVTEILLVSLSLFCVLMGGMLWAKKIERKTRIPFLPFVLIGYLVACPDTIPWRLPL